MKRATKKHITAVATTKFNIYLVSNWISLGNIIMNRQISFD